LTLRGIRGTDPGVWADGSGSFGARKLDVKTHSTQWEMSKV